MARKTYKNPTEKQIKEEARLLKEWGLIGHGYSKSFRDAWANKPRNERISYLKFLIEDGRQELAAERAMMKMELDEEQRMIRKRKLKRMC